VKIEQGFSKLKGSCAKPKRKIVMKILLLFILYAIALSASLARAGLRLRVKASPRISQKRPQRLLIVGATGGTGRQLVAQALERGYSVTALVRNPAKLKIEHSQLTVIQGDVLDYDSVETVMRGQEAVLSALGHKRYFYPTRILSKGTQNILRAMETHGVQRFICETSLGIGNSAGRMGLYYTLFIIPVILPFYFWDKARQEKLIAASEVEWVIVRPGVLTNRAKRGTYRHGSNVGSFIWTVNISRADVAEFMLDQITDDAYLRTATGVC
jgi:putative NADH-flavin reductase